MTTNLQIELSTKKACNLIDALDQAQQIAVMLGVDVLLKHGENEQVITPNASITEIYQAITTNDNRRETKRTAPKRRG